MGEPGDQERIQKAAEIEYVADRDPALDPNVVKYSLEEYRAKMIQRQDLIIDQLDKLADSQEKMARAVVLMANKLQATAADGS